jgi:hypothetical protein
MAARDPVMYESSVRVRRTVVAGAAGILLLVAAALQLAGAQPKVSELTIQLITIHKRYPLDVISAAVSALGILGLVATMTFLFGSARDRRPEMSPAIKIALIAGGVVAGIGGMVFAAVLAVRANQFVHHGTQTYLQADHIRKGPLIPALQTLDIAASFALAIGIVLISLNAMRVGLLTRFMGYFGILVGVAGMLLIGSPPAAALEIFWMFALAFLFAGTLPGGQPPAWKTGRAEPWPSSAELRKQREGAARDRRGAKPSREPAPETVGGLPPARTRATTPKRKRKRRR